MLSTIGRLRTALQSTTDASDTDRAIKSEDLARILSTGMQWDLDCSNIEEHFRCEHASLAVKCYACTCNIDNWKPQMMCISAKL